MHPDLKILLILEFGIPPYRLFLFEALHKAYRHFRIRYIDDRFIDEIKLGYSKKIFSIKLPYNIRVGFYNIFSILKQDVIITNMNTRRIHCLLPVLLFPHKKWILWGHGYGENRGRVLEMFKRYVLSKSDAFIVYNQLGKGYLINQLKYPKEKIFISNNTMHINNSSLDGHKIDKEYILYVGRIQERKKLGEVIRTMRDIKNIDLKLMIVGDGDYKSELERLVLHLNLQESVLFLPATFDEVELKKIFDKAYAYISPQNLGLGIVHSFAYGVPIITQHNVPHGPEFLYCNDKNAFFYSGNSELKDTMIKIKKSPDSALEKGISAFNTYSNELSIEKMTSAFHNAITMVSKR